MFQVDQKDVPGRLRLLRYGLITTVITAFLVSFFTQWRTIGALPNSPGMGAFFVNALVTTAIVAVLAVIVYFAYRFILNKTVGSDSE